MDGLPPGPRMPAALQTLGWWARPIPVLERCRRELGSRFTLSLLGQGPFVMISDPDQLKEVFTAPVDSLHPGEGARILKPIVGSNSILLLDEGEHLAQRRLVLPAFHGERMAALTEIIREATEQEIATWPRGEAVAMHPHLQRLTLEVILRAVFGLERGSERLASLRHTLAEMLEFGLSPVSLLEPLQRSFGGLSAWSRFIALRERTDAELHELIAERRAEGEADHGDVISTFIAARHPSGEPMSDEEIRDELLTLLVAGHETTATQLSWTLERLVRNPDVLSRLVADVDAGQDAYLQATIKESLRRRPVLTNAQPRKVVKPIEVGGWEYPVGCHLVPCVYLVQHDASIYPDPYVFRPERFLDIEPGTYTWIPFGGGRRRCAGASFALLEMEIVLAELLRGTEIRAGSDAPELSRRRAITVSPARGAETVLSRREGARRERPLLPAA